LSQTLKVIVKGENTKREPCKSARGRIDGRFIDQYMVMPDQKTMQLNVSNFANGTYIYLLSAEGELIARKKPGVSK
jgi:hypothetical protein